MKKKTKEIAKKKKKKRAVNLILINLRIEKP